MVNKNYRNGAEDVAEVASEVMKAVGDKADKIGKDVGNYTKKQGEFNEGVIDAFKELDQRFLAVEYKLPSIDFGLVDSLPPEKRAFLGGIMRSIVLPNNECRRTADLIISRFGVEPLATISNDQIGSLSQDVQRFCTYYLYLVLRKTDGNADTEASINSVLDEFLISNKEKRQIKSVVDTYSISDIDELIRVRKGGKQNIVLIGKTEALSATLINSVLGRAIVNDGFYNGTDIVPEPLETNGSPIRFCGIFKVGYDTTKNAHVIEMAKKIVSSKSDINRVSNIWYCVNTSSHRVEPYELLLLKELLFTFQNVGVIVVFTSCISKKTAKTLADVIESEISSSRIRFVNVLTESFTLDNGQTINPYGTDDLISLTLKDDSEGL